MPIKKLLHAVCFWVFAICLGLYVEDYEAIISSIVSSTYTSIALTDFDFDAATIFIPLLAHVDMGMDSQFRVYDYFILSLNFLAFVSIGGIINNFFDSRWIFVVTSIILLLPSVLNTGITRVSFYLFFIACYYFLFKKDSLKLGENVLFFIIILLLCLFRVDAILLSSLILLTFIFVTKKKFRLIFLLPLVISSLFYISYNVWMTNNPNEAKKAFYYEEFDFFDRELVKSSLFSDNSRHTIELATEYSIYDEEMFKYGYFSQKSSGTNFFYLTDGILSLESFQNTFKNSFKDLKKSSYIILVSLLLFLISVFIDKKNISGVLLFSIPFLIIFLVIIPARFIVPYYTLLSFYSLYKLYISKKIKVRFLLVFINLIVTIQLVLDINEKLIFNSLSKQYSYELKKIENDYPEYNIILERFNPQFHVFRFSDNKIETKAALLHYFYFTSFDSYRKKWRTLCPECNNRSIKDKLMFLSRSKCIFVASPFYLDALKNYMLVKHGIRLEGIEINDFFQDLNVYRLETTLN